MNAVFLGASFLISAVFLPWWVTAIILVIMLSVARLYWVAVFGGVIMDILFNAPGMYLWMYTTAFGAVALLAWYLSAHVLE